MLIQQTPEGIRVERYAPVLSIYLLCDYAYLTGLYVYLLLMHSKRLLFLSYQ
jgi:hypothetical protein